MTDRERLEKILICFPLGKDESELIAEELIKNGVTFKKEREYIRKLPCKCGASNRKVEFWNCCYGWYYKCKICGNESNPIKNKSKALIEWNKMNEVDNEI